MLLLVFVASCAASGEVFYIMKDILRSTPTSALIKLDFTYTFFSSLESYHVGAKIATTKTYPWIGQVVHSRTTDYPYMCTAVCVHDGVFMTAARCIIRLKVKHTSVIYNSKRKDVRAFVVPSKQTVQQFDDIGFIVLEHKNDTFHVAPLYTPQEVKRTDEAFNWFDNMRFDLKGPFKAVGYVMNKDQHRHKIVEEPHTLRDLSVVVDLDLCYDILTNHKKNGFRVPCYHFCTVEKTQTNVNANKTCESYLGVEGAAVVHTKTKKVLGVATWGTALPEFNLPVGFAVVNSQVFLEDLECAKKIRNSQSIGSYQALCKL